MLSVIQSFDVHNFRRTCSIWTAVHDGFKVLGSELGIVPKQSMTF